MVSVTIRNIPDETRDELARRARRSGRSMQEYLLDLMKTTAARPDVPALLSEHRAKLQGSGVTTESILEAIRDTRR